MNYIAHQANIEANTDSCIHENEREQRMDYFIDGGEFVRDKVAAEIIDIIASNEKMVAIQYKTLRMILEILKKY